MTSEVEIAAAAHQDQKLHTALLAAMEKEWPQIAGPDADKADLDAFATYMQSKINFKGNRVKKDGGLHKNVITELEAKGRTHYGDFKNTAPQQNPVDAIDPSLNDAPPAPAFSAADPGISGDATTRNGLADRALADPQTDLPPVDDTDSTSAHSISIFAVEHPSTLSLLQNGGLKDFRALDEATLRMLLALRPDYLKDPAFLHALNGLAHHLNVPFESLKTSQDAAVNAQVAALFKQHSSLFSNGIDNFAAPFVAVACQTVQSPNGDVTNFIHFKDAQNRVYTDNGFGVSMHAVTDDEFTPEHALNIISAYTSPRQKPTEDGQLQRLHCRLNNGESRSNRILGALGMTKKGAYVQDTLMLMTLHDAATKNILPDIHAESGFGTHAIREIKIDKIDKKAYEKCCALLGEDRVRGLIDDFNAQWSPLRSEVSISGEPIEPALPVHAEALPADDASDRSRSALGTNFHASSTHTPEDAAAVASTGRIVPVPPQRRPAV